MLKVVSCLVALVVSSVALAAEDRTGAPYFHVASQAAADALPLKETRAKVSIAGVIAHVRVTQVYQNEGQEPLEAVYVFPGSTRAAVFGMQMKIGERTIVAEIEEREKAKKRYDQAKKEGKSASLLQQHRPNVFQMNVANIMPGDRIEVALDYTELLVPTEGVYELTYPTVVGPRFTGEKERQEGWTANPHLKAGDEPPYRWGLSARIAAGMKVSAVKSPSHRISPRFSESGAVDVEVLDPNGGDRDFVLRYRLDGDRIETGVLLHEGKEENVFAAILQPPRRVAPAMIPPREYVFIIDVSGSMGGFPIDTAKTLLANLLSGLRTQDRFNLVLFAGGSRVMAEESVAATPANLERAKQIVDRMRGGGGTRLLNALDRALAMPRSEEMSTTMVVITDGYISVEKEAFTRIRDSLGEANLFAFGIGSSVNRHLIEGMARHGMGRPFVVMKPSEAKAAARRFERYVKSPVLTNVELEIEGLDAYDVEPKHLPDLFGERPLVVMGKYRGEAKGTIRLTGVNGEGRVVRTLEITDYPPSDDLVALRYLWARDRIARLSDMATIGDDNKEEVTKLGLRYHLMTAYTSFVAVDEVVRNTDGRRTTVRQPLPMPKGVSNQAVGSAAGIGGLGMIGTGRGGGGAGYSGSFMLRGGGKGSAPRMSAGESVVMGSLSKNTISRVIKRHVARVRRCYERQLKSNPNLIGKVSIRLTIGADGKVKKVEIANSTLKDEQVERCLLRAMKKMRFAPPSGGGEIVVSYPFVFRPR